jgi:glycine/D-amino acid oxidase-like deaminating enzyme
MVVTGLGAAGAAITCELARRGKQVAALDRADGVASTLSNQKWKHTGLLYPRPDLAQKMWDAYAHMHPIERRHLLKQGAYFVTHLEQSLVEREARWRNWGIPFERLAPDTLPTDRVLGKPAYAGGFLTPDSVIDFLALLPDLCAQAERLGARIVTGATVKRLVRDSDEVTGVIYEKAGQETVLHCRHCIVALGGWAPEALHDMGVHLPVHRWKSHILTVEGELVERITVFLDDPFMTLVPYKGRTLIADTRRAPAADGDDRTPIPELVEALKADLAACFPSLRWRALNMLSVHACIKTEADLSGMGLRNQDMVVFDAAFHGVRGLTVVFPGKASLMFALAREVAETLPRLCGGAEEPGCRGEKARPPTSV